MEQLLILSRVNDEPMNQRIKRHQAHRSGEENAQNGRALTQKFQVFADLMKIGSRKVY